VKFVDNHHSASKLCYSVLQVWHIYCDISWIVEISNNSYGKPRITHCGRHCVAHRDACCRRTMVWRCYKQ